MIDLQNYIFESQSPDIKVLTKYIYDLLAKYIYMEPDNPKYKTALNEYVHEYDGEFDIDVNFSDIDGFTNKYNLRTWRIQNNINAALDDCEEHNCDLLIRVTDDVSGFGAMDTDCPTLNIGTSFITSVKKFEKSSTDLKNTIAHELTHYVQFMGNVGMNMLDFKSKNVSKEFRKGTAGNLHYFTVNFIIYAWDPIERDARKSGFYETMENDIEKRLKEWNKQHKKEQFDREAFADYVIHHDSYNENTLHIGIFDEFNKDLKEDTWKNYAECLSDTKNKYKDNSIIYVLLNSSDEYTSKPPFPLPSKKNYVLSITSEERFNEYKAKLIKYFNKDYDKYKKKLKKVVLTVLDNINN